MSMDITSMTWIDRALKKNPPINLLFLSGGVYTRCYVIVVMRYGNIVHCYSNVMSAGTNRDADASV